MRCSASRGRRGGRFICVDLGLVAARAAELLSEGERARIVGVGTSGAGFARRINPAAPAMEIATRAFNRDRAYRWLEVEPQCFAFRPVLVDDLAVSGRRLEEANKVTNPTAETALVGLLFKSRSTLRAIGVTGLEDVRCVAKYTQVSGNVPPMNSLSTLQANPERLQDLAKACYGDKAQAFIDAVGRARA